MKRNEKLLVYGVTGFLAVIVLVAVLFGGGNNPQTRDRAEVPAGQPGTEVERLSLAELLNKPSQEASQDGEPEQPEAELQPGPTGPAGASPDGYSLSVSNSLGGSAAQQVTQLLGASRIQNGYRMVEINRGDTLSELVERWCPEVANASALVRRLNENLVGANPSLIAGRSLLMPMVDDAVLLEAFQKRLARIGEPTLDPSGEFLPANSSSSGVAAPAVATPAPATAAPATSANDGASAGSGSYTVVAGDSAWKIAKKLGISANQTPGWIERLKAANPQVADIGSLSLKQRLNLPGN